MLQMTDALRKKPACSLAALLKAAEMEQLYPISVTKNEESCHYLSFPSERRWVRGGNTRAVSQQEQADAHGACSRLSLQREVPARVWKDWSL